MSKVAIVAVAPRALRIGGDQYRGGVYRNPTVGQLHGDSSYSLRTSRLRGGFLARHS